MADNYNIALAAVSALTLDEKNKLFHALQLEHFKVSDSLPLSVHLRHKCHICRSKREGIVCDGCLSYICNDDKTSVDIHECTLCLTEFTCCEDGECEKELIITWECDCLNDYPYPGICVECAISLNQLSFECKECGKSTTNPIIKA